MLTGEIDLHIPAGFARRTVEVHGEAGAERLRRLPSLINECASRWSLTVLPPFEPLSYNCVVWAVRAGGGDTAAVLQPANAQTFFALRFLEIICMPAPRHL